MIYITKIDENGITRNYQVSRNSKLLAMGIIITTIIMVSIISIIAVNLIY